jgi:glucosamine-6-phosphate deaminase
MVKVVELEESCRRQQVNDGCFPTMDDVPSTALTLTIPALLSANKHFCIVPSALKAQALHDALLGTIDERCPASILRRKAGVMMYTDRDGAKLL